MKARCHNSNPFVSVSVILTIFALSSGGLRATVTLNATDAFVPSTPANGDLNVTGNLSVWKGFDVGTSVTNSTWPAIQLDFYNVTGMLKTASFDLTDATSTFQWRDNNYGTARKKMKLDGSNVLSLYNSSGSTTPITLNGATGAIAANSINAAAAITTSGALSAGSVNVSGQLSASTVSIGDTTSFRGNYLNGYLYSNTGIAMVGGVCYAESSIAMTGGNSTSENSVAMSNGITSGNSAVAMAFGNAGGYGSVAMSQGFSEGAMSTAMSGGGASGDCSTAMSWGYAIGNASTAMSGGIAYGQGSAAISGGSATGPSSTGLSGGSATGDYSTAVSYGVAEGQYSTAAGFQAYASSYCGVALGSNTLNTGNSPNTWVETDPILLVGNGTGENGMPTTTYSNALVILKNGLTTLTNKAWKAEPTVELTNENSHGEALVVEGHTRLTGNTTLEGKVSIAIPQGDITMGIFQ